MAWSYAQLDMQNIVYPVQYVFHQAGETLSKGYNSYFSSLEISSQNKQQKIESTGKHNFCTKKHNFVLIKTTLEGSDDSQVRSKKLFF